jgi:hypothetical protein
VSTMSTPEHPEPADKAPEDATMEMDTDSAGRRPSLPEGEAVATAPAVAPAPARPTGPHLPPILLGLACLLVAGLALAQELGGVSIDWADVGPLGIVALGALLVVFGLVGLTLSRRRADAWRDIRTDVRPQG